MIIFKRKKDKYPFDVDRKPKLGITEIHLKWKNVKHLWKSEYCLDTLKGLFYTGGGSFQDFGFPDRTYRQKHYYFYHWCYLTINKVEISNVNTSK